MTTIILIYFLIGWIAGFILTIYYFFHSDWDEKAISIVQAILYWPWALIIFICILIREGVKYIERKKKRK